MVHYYWVWDRQVHEISHWNAVARFPQWDKTIPKQVQNKDLLKECTLATESFLAVCVDGGTPIVFPYESSEVGDKTTINGLDDWYTVTLTIKYSQTPTSVANANAVSGNPLFGSVVYHAHEDI